MLDITLEQIINAIGQPTYKKGNRYFFGCPSCGVEDGHKDNLIFDERKGLLKCFACDNGAKYVLNLINKKNTKTFESMPKIIEDTPLEKAYQNNQKLLLSYWEGCMQELQDNPSYFKILQEQHNINRFTAEECGIGLDLDVNIPGLKLNKACWVFPKIYNGDIFNFEFREVFTKKKIHVISGCKEQHICKVWGIDSCIDNYDKYAIITEGFKDGYNLFSLLYNKFNKNIYKWFIYTCPTGVTSLKNYIKDIDWSQFANCYLLLDNDKAGDDVTKDIIDKYSFFIDKRDLLKGYKDVTEYLGELNVKI